MSLKANLKRYFVSPWFYILFVPVLALSVLLYLTSGNEHLSGFVYRIPIINVYLTVYVTVFSAYAAHSIKEIEWSVKSRVCIVAKGIASANIFCFSAVIIPVVFTVFGCIQKGLPFELGSNYIFYIVCLTFVQTIFLSALGFLMGTVIKGRVAYVCAVLLSVLFTPIAQNFLAGILEQNADKVGLEKAADHTWSLALTNLINLSLDDPSAPNYAGYGMPFNSETVLSWVITALAGIVLICAVFAVTRAFKLKGTAVLYVFSAAVIVSGAYCVKQYFEASPIVRYFDYQYIQPIDGSPAKPDTAHIYSDENSPIISRYNMKLDTGNTVKNVCELELNVNNSSSVKLRLDQCFNIHSLTVNGEESDYEREGDYFTVSLDSSEERAVIALEYSGRMNYAGALHKKVDVCDYTGGFFSGMFAWYPKLLSSQNCRLPKTFTVEINAVNRFVTNLDGYILHSSGKQTVEGEKTDIMFYLGYIGEINNCGGSENGFKIILPTEYAKDDGILEKISIILNLDSVKTYRNYFTRFKLFEWKDFKKTETTLVSYEELKTFTENRLAEVGADEEHTDEVNGLLAELEDIWNDSLTEKLENPENYPSDEAIAVDGFFMALKNAEEDAAETDYSDVSIVIIVPFSFNTIFDAYIFEDSVIASEGYL